MNANVTLFVSSSLAEPAPLKIYMDDQLVADNVIADPAVFWENCGKVALGASLRVEIASPENSERGDSPQQTFSFSDVAYLTSPLSDAQLNLHERLTAVERNITQDGLDAKDYFELVPLRSQSGGVFGSVKALFSGAKGPAPEALIAENEARLGVVLPSVVHSLAGLEAVHLYGMGDSMLETPGGDVREGYQGKELQGIISVLDFYQDMFRDEWESQIPAEHRELYSELLAMGSDSGDGVCFIAWHHPTGLWYRVYEGRAPEPMKDVISGEPLADIDAMLCQLDIVEVIQNNRDLTAEQVTLDSSVQSGGLLVSVVQGSEGLEATCRWFDGKKVTDFGTP